MHAATVRLLIKPTTRTLIASLPGPVLLSQTSATLKLPSLARPLQSSHSILISLAIWVSRRAISLLLSRRLIIVMIGGQVESAQEKAFSQGKLTLLLISFSWADIDL